MSLKYLVTILYRARATMRRILATPQRWTWQVVILAAICTSVNDASDLRVAELFPGLRLMPFLAIVALSLIANAFSWCLFWLILSWIAFGVGKLLGGTGTASDVRAAAAWALVPAIWSPLFRIPFGIYAMRFHVGQQTDPHKAVVDFLLHGGLSVVVVYLFLLVVSEAGCVALACFTVAEAEKFSTQKGFVAVASTLALPILVTLAAIFSFRS